MKEALSDITIQRSLGNLAGWSRKGDAVTKTFQLLNFVAAMEFVNKIAVIAEKAGHHPDIDIRYNKVIIALSTHDAGGITQKDLDLAKEIEAIWSSGELTLA
jgi:4a-hydroxytetrahydrobiopterin dehydratase